MTAISSLTEPIDSELLRWPEAQAPTGQPLRGWDITIGNRHKQSVATDFTDGSAPRLRLSSQTADYKLVLSSPLVRVRPGMKFTFSGMVMKSTNFAGNVTFNIALTRTTNGVEETVPSFLSKTPNISRRGGWLQARQTFELPARSTSMRVEIRGGFRGDVLVGDVSLKRRE